MLPDFELIQHQFYGGHDINIYPIFDVHLGSPECKEQDFIKFVNRIAETPDAYVLLGGDLIDNGTKSSVTNCFRATLSPSAQKREMANILMPLAEKGKILAITPGNHERRNKDVDDDPVYDIASKLDCEHLYRENVCFIKIQLGEEGAKNGYARPTYVLVMTHGAGGGVLSGSALNRNERWGYCMDGVDAIITGHTHKPMTSQPGKLVVDSRNNVVSVKPFKVIVATSWLEYGGYAARYMLMPASHCLNSLTLCGGHKEMIVTM